MANFQIITNNPMVADKYPSITKLLKCDVAGVFISVRDVVHMGAVVISHPLSGSIKPNESPFKSVMVSTDTGNLDIDSLRLIEGAEAVLRKMPVKNRKYSERELEDFQVIDLDLMDSAMFGLPPKYHI